MAKQAVTVFLEDNGVVIMEMKTEYRPEAFINWLKQDYLRQFKAGLITQEEFDAKRIRVVTSTSTSLSSKLR